MLRLADHVARVGVAASTPIAVARVDRSGTVDAFASGTWPDGAAVAPDDRFYFASLAKQLTGAAAALLVSEGRLDPDQPIGPMLDELPEWAATITPRQLAHHIAGLPPAGELEPQAGGDWTEPAAMAALKRSSQRGFAGERYTYSNIGYILLARIVAIVGEMPFREFVETRLLAPYGLTDLGFTSEIDAFPQLPLMGAMRPLTQGDGGLWSSAPAFARWLHLLNTDRLGLAGLIEAPGHLADGTAVDYGWGVGLREHRGHPLFIHGGEWTGAVAKAVRCPALGIGIVAMAAGAPFDPVDGLVAALLNDG